HLVVCNFDYIRGCPAALHSQCPWRYIGIIAITVYKFNHNIGMLLVKLPNTITQSMISIGKCRNQLDSQNLSRTISLRVYSILYIYIQIMVRRHATSNRYRYYDDEPNND